MLYFDIRHIEKLRTDLHIGVRHLEEFGILSCMLLSVISNLRRCKYQHFSATELALSGKLTAAKEVSNGGNRAEDIDNCVVFWDAPCSKCIICKILIYRRLLQFCTSSNQVGNIGFTLSGAW
jgi:hypothetical protein